MPSAEKCSVLEVAALTTLPSSACSTHRSRATVLLPCCNSRNGVKAGLCKARSVHSVGVPHCQHRMPPNLPAALAAMSDVSSGQHLRGRSAYALSHGSAGVPGVGDQLGRAQPDEPLSTPAPVRPSAAHSIPIPGWPPHRSACWVPQQAVRQQRPGEPADLIRSCSTKELAGGASTALACLARTSSDR